MAQNKSKFGNITKKIDSLPDPPQSAIAQRAFGIESNNSEVNKSEADYSEGLRYSPIPEDRVATFYEFKSITWITEDVKSKGYRVTLEDEKRIFEYMLANPLSEGIIPSYYIGELVSALNLLNLEVTPTEKLFKEGNLQKSSSSLVTDTFYCVCVSKNLPILTALKDLDEKKSTVTKTFSSGDINLYIAEDIETTIIKDFGIDTYKIFQLLLCYWYENSGIMGQNVRVSVADLMEYIARKNKVVKDPETNKSMKLTREVNHSFLAHHTKLLDRVSVYSSGITPNIKGKKAFAISQTKLIEFTEFIFFPQQENGKIDYTNLKDMYLEYRIGKWFQYFNDEKFLPQYGYTHREAFSSSGLVSALLHWLAFKLEQNQRGEFKVRTIIDQIGLKPKLDAIHSETDPKKLRDLKQDLYRVLMSALTEIKEGIEDPYQWEFKTAIDWVMNEALKKPRGWFNTWLELVIIFRHPQVLIDVGKEYRREKIKTIEVKPEPKVEKVKTTEDLKFVMDKFKISIRELVKKSDNKYTYYKLQKSLKENSLKDSEVRELLKHCYQINHSRKK